MPTVTDHPLAALLHEAARRRFPAPDGALRVFPPLDGPCDAAVAFTGHSAVAADVPEEWVRERVPEGWSDEHQHPGTVSVRFLHALAERLGVTAPLGANILLAAVKPAQSGPRAALGPSERIQADWAGFRSDVVAYETADGAGVINLGRGPGGRLDLWVGLEGAEASYLRPATMSRGRDLLRAARTVATDDLFASVPVYDARALSTFLAGGFHVVAAEALLLTRPRAGG
jgi:hypothetical protein